MRSRLALAAVLADLEVGAERGRAPEPALVGRLAAVAQPADDPGLRRAARTAAVATVLADRLGLAGADVGAIGVAALLRDLGKVAVPRAVLLAGRSLDAAELEAVRHHAEVGHRLLDGLGGPVLARAAEVALAHHERWDGHGYPLGLRGEAIGLDARIVAVASVFTALLADRPDRPAHPYDDAVDLVLTGAGSRFDPAVVEAFDEVAGGLRSIAVGPGAAGVVIVEDDRLVADALCALLVGLTDLRLVGRATSATAALDTVRAAAPAVALVGSVPDGDSVGLCRAVRARAGGCAVVLLTRRPDDTLVVAALRAGCAGVVTHEDDGRAVVEALRTAAGGGSTLPAGEVLDALTRVAGAGPAPTTALSAREVEVLGLLGRGLDPDTIADRLLLSGHTVRNHLRNAMAKLDAHTRLDAVTTAARLGLIDLS